MISGSIENFQDDIMKQYDILSLIPQKPPFVMIDALLTVDEKGATGVFKISEKNLFLADGFLAEAALIENIAQTAAAGVGYRAGITKEPVPVGYIGAIKDLQIFSLPKIGDTIVTEVSVVNKVFDVTLVNGSIYCNDQLAATCEMKIFISKQS